MLFLFVIILVHSSILNSIQSAKILAVFPVPSISHQVVFRTLTHKLAQLGHDLTVVTPDPAFSNGESPPNLKEIDVHDISYKIWTDTIINTSKGRKSDLATQIKIIIETMNIILEAQFESREVQQIINAKNNTYDLLLIEACVRPALVFSHLFKAPVIAVSSLGAMPWNYEITGVPEHPTLFPSSFSLRIHNLTLWEKVTEIFNTYQLNRIFDNDVILENRYLKKWFGPATPGVEELTNNIDMLFLNTNPVFEGIRPVPPNVIYMGGLHQKPTKALPTDLKQYLDSSKAGIIYVSFGTNVNPILLPAEKVQILVRAFSKLPYDVMLKWNDENLSECSDNIRIFKWLPQSDLLKHPKVKLFITQGGLQSTDEAITAGVPLIGIPMLADQWYNVENSVRHGIGIKLDLETLTEEQLINGINRVIEDISYRNNIVKLRTLMTDEPMTPLERAVWWTEYVLRHGGAKHLKSPTANISWSQYLELNLVLTVLSVILLILAVSFVGMFYLYKYFVVNIKIKTL